MSPEYINANEASAREIEKDERMTYCLHMAAWLLHEKNYNQIVN